MADYSNPKTNYQGKYNRLCGLLRDFDSLAVAFSGGADSTLLLAVAHQALDDKSLAIIVKSPIFPQRESQEALEFVNERNINHLIIHSEDWKEPGFRSNPPNRCYNCKKSLFRKIIDAASLKGITAIADGTNADDHLDYRPGLKALAELKIHTPLKEAGLTKTEIRVLSKKMGLSTWDKPQTACLATRFPYGNEITREALSMVEKAENALWEMGFNNLRVRHHGTVARIESAPQDIPRIAGEMRERIACAFKTIGYVYASLDLQGYRTGSMNETLIKESD